MKTCLFCDIASGKSPASIVYEDPLTLAFLDIRPLFPGHVLVIPRDHVETYGELPAALLGPVMESAQLLARAVQEGLEAEGTFIAINNTVSQSVPHLHVHVVPRRRKDGLKGFFWPRRPYRDEKEMEDVRDRLRRSVERVRLGEG